jgi:hypothetical protein
MEHSYSSMLIEFPLIFLGIGYLLTVALTAYLIHTWRVVPESLQGPRFKIFRQLNVMALVLACLAALAVMTVYYLSGQITFVGLPIVVLLFLSAGSPKRFEKK